MGGREREREEERATRRHTVWLRPRASQGLSWAVFEAKAKAPARSLTHSHSLSLTLFLSLALSLCVLVFPAALSNCLRFCRGFVCGMQQFWSCSQRLTKCDVRVADGDADGDVDADVDTEVVAQIRTTTSCACVCVPVCVCSFKLLVHRCGNRQTRILRSSFMTTRLHSPAPPPQNNLATNYRECAVSAAGGEANWIGLERTALLTYRWRQHKHGTKLQQKTRWLRRRISTNG